jgi:berberine-like enzyme
VATAFELRLDPVGPLVTAGLVLYPVERATELLRFYRDYLADAPDELYAVVTFMTAPPAPFAPASAHGSPVVALFVCHCGALEEGTAAVALLDALGSALAEQIGPMPYGVVQHLPNAAHPPGRRYERRAHHLDALGDNVIRTLVAHAPGAESPLSSVQVLPWGSGAVRRVAPASTAVGPRDTPVAVEYFAAWTAPEEEQEKRHLGWLAEAWSALRSFARLVAVKQRYDPTNLFRLNQNIPPTDANHG